MQGTPSSQNITIKIAITIALLLVDLVLSSFIQTEFTSKFGGTNYQVNFYFLPIQILITGLILISMIILMWQTFPLRYGLILSMLSEFKWTFIVMFLFLGITGAERGYKLSMVISQQRLFSQRSVWNQPGYQVLYYLRFLAYPIFYGTVISFCMRIIDPSFYRPHRWLK